jgi:hypothetical protein
MKENNNNKKRSQSYSLFFLFLGSFSLSLSPCVLIEYSTRKCYIFLKSSSWTLSVSSPCSSPTPTLSLLVVTRIIDEWIDDDESEENQQQNEK